MPRSLVQSNLFQPIGPYSHAVVAGGQIFISGTPGVDPSTGQLAGDAAYIQTQQILRNIGSILFSTDAQFNDVVHVQVNLLNVNDYAEMNRAYVEFFHEPYPARTVIAVAALPKQGSLLTMDAIAMLKNDASYLPPASSTTSKNADVEQAGQVDTGEA